MSPRLANPPGERIGPRIFLSGFLWDGRPTRPEDCLCARLQPGAQILDHLLLSVDHDLTFAGESGQVDAMAAPIETQLDAVMDRPSRSIRPPTPVSRSNSTVPCSNRRLHLFASSEFEHYRVDALQMQQSWSTSDDPYLCAYSSSLLHASRPTELSCLRLSAGRARACLGQRPFRPHLLRAAD